ncbi:hypothetical protein SETIT_1G365700v2 [Setaria italica]|uniref:Uncharacterized protein n=1 Tax=Setaria italica TaxID=4555 RepID=A0A368PT04_SETIT|nr:hypothetical protein SETIT_1G365700v2 [Setaria italica]
MLRYKDMTRKFLNLALRAASHPGCTLLVNNTLDILSKQAEEEIDGCTSTMDPVIVPTNFTPPSELVITARLKKKEVQTNTSKRKKTWLDKKRKGKKKGSKTKGKGPVEQGTAKVAIDGGAAVHNIPPSTSQSNEGISQSYMAINTFSQLLTGAMTDDFNAEF